MEDGRIIAVEGLVESTFRVGQPVPVTVARYLLDRELFNFTLGDERWRGRRVSARSARLGVVSGRRRRPI